jgi:hypothetical protein
MAREGRMVENIKMGLEEPECEGADCLQVIRDGVLRQDLVNMIMNVCVAKEAENFLTSDCCLMEDFVLWRLVCSSYYLLISHLLFC